MLQETFRGGVHYGDLKGTVAADHQHASPLDKLFQSQIKQGEFLVGYQVSCMESAAGKTLTVRAHLTSYTPYENVQAAIDSGEPLKVRKVSLEMPTVDFFACFKEFEMCVSTHGMLTNKEILFESE